jgi:CRP-like cAMP-binding protein
MEALSKCPLFAGIPTDTIRQLITLGHYQFRTYEASTLVVHAGQTCNNLLILTHGSIRADMLDNNDHLIKIEDIESPNALAPAFVFGHSNIFPVTLTASTDIEILVLPRETLLRMFQQNALFLTNYLNAISDRAQFLSQKLNFLSFNSIKGKIAQYLLKQHVQMGEHILLQASQEELASTFGVARPSLTREFRELHKQKIIFAKGKKIQILDLARLKALLR